MARRNTPSEIAALDAKRSAEARTREELGIASLTEDEELIDEDAFSEIHLQTLAQPISLGSELPPYLDPNRPTLDPETSQALQDESLLEQTVIELPRERRRFPRAEPAAPGLAPPASPAEVATLEAQLAAAGDRDQVIDLALRLARMHADAVGLLVVNKGMIVGMRAVGGGIDERIEGIVQRSTGASLLNQPAMTGKTFRGTPPRNSTNQRLMRALGRSHACEVLVAPVMIVDRAVNLIYADNGPDALGDTSVASLCAVARCMSRAYERIILERKRADS